MLNDNFSSDNRSFGMIFSYFYRLSARQKYIISVCAILVCLVAVIIGLTLGLRTPPAERGGSPPDKVFDDDPVYV